MQLKYILRYLSSAPILIGVWLTLTGLLWTVFNYVFPDLLFHPMPYS